MVELKCQYCGKVFLAKTRKSKWCSKRCKDIVFRTQYGIKCNPNIEPYKKICVVCGKAFETFRGSDKCCSHECTIENGKSSKHRNGKNSGGKSRNQHTLEEYNRLRKEQAKQNAETKKIEKMWYVANHTVQRECKICGSLFYCLDKSSDKTCSHECSRKLRNKRRDRRIPESQIIDKDITIEKLYKRDNGKCWICGGNCNFDDIAISKKGYPYPGDNYPEIEHVIPVSRGGLHAWDNVRLAHRKCNADKGVKMYPYVPMRYEYAYKEKHIGTQAKKTAQYTLDGKLIKIWDSTAQIERELGLNSKHIQNICRRVKSNTGNAYGYHWKYVV